MQPLKALARGGNTRGIKEIKVATVSGKYHLNYAFSICVDITVLIHLQRHLLLLA